MGENSVHYESPCGICGGKTWSSIYQGPIRVGKFGNSSKGAHTVYSCNQCGAGYLPEVRVDYESSEYRTLVNDNNEITTYYALADADQADKLRKIGTARFRNKVIADVGCGGGSFLDFVQGAASKVLAIEPNKAWHAPLAERGYQVFSYSSDALGPWRNKVDVITSFFVMEHVDQPRQFLADIYGLLSPGGHCIIAVPNREDWLNTLLPTDYAAFHYRVVHKWYFEKTSLQNLAELVGFKSVEISYQQTFDISNALVWIRDRKPSGLAKLPLLAGLDGAYRQHLENIGRSNFIYLIAHK